MTSQLYHFLTHLRLPKNRCTCYLKGVGRKAAAMAQPWRDGPPYLAVRHRSKPAAGLGRKAGSGGCHLNTLPRLTFIYLFIYSCQYLFIYLFLSIPLRGLGLHSCRARGCPAPLQGPANVPGVKKWDLAPMLSLVLACTKPPISLKEKDVGLWGFFFFSQLPIGW